MNTKKNQRVLYVVYAQDPDCVHDFQWSSVWPTKKQAMAEAKKYSVGMEVVYGGLDNLWAFDPAKYIIVCPLERLIR